MRYLCVGFALFLLGTVIVFVAARGFGWDVRLAEASGRIVGACVGFLAHRWITFPTAPGGARALRGQTSSYVALAILNVLVAPWVLYALYHALDSQLLLAKVLTEAILVGETYAVLRVVVFAQRGPSQRAE